MRNFSFRFLLLISLVAPVLGLADTWQDRLFGGRFQAEPPASIAPQPVIPKVPVPCYGDLNYKPFVQGETGETTIVKGDLEVTGFAKIGGHSVGIGKNFLAVTDSLFGIRVKNVSDMNEAAASPDRVTVFENGDMKIAGAVTAQAFNTVGSIEVKDDTITGDNGMISFKVTDKKKGNPTNVNIMTITADKRVGIGTDSPATELDVRGKITGRQLCLPMDSTDFKSKIICFKRLCSDPKTGNFMLSTKKHC